MGQDGTTRGRRRAASKRSTQAPPVRCAPVLRASRGCSAALVRLACARRGHPPQKLHAPPAASPARTRRFGQLRAARRAPRARSPSATQYAHVTCGMGCFPSSERRLQRVKRNSSFQFLAVRTPGRMSDAAWLCAQQSCCGGARGRICVRRAALTRCARWDCLLQTPLRAETQRARGAAGAMRAALRRGRARRGGPGARRTRAAAATSHRLTAPHARTRS